MIKYSELNIKTLLNFLENKDSFRWNGKKWVKNGRFFHMIERFFISEEKKTLLIASELISLFDEIEHRPLLYKEESENLYTPQMEITCFIIKKLRLYSSQQALELRRTLAQKLLSLKYRLEEKNGGIEIVPVQKPLVNLLKKIVREWKEAHPLKKATRDLSEKDLLQITLTSQYPEFVHLMIEDKTIRDKFMIWTFQDGNMPQVFIEYPALQEKLTKSLLSSRIGRIGCHCLKVIKRAKIIGNVTYLEKIVTLPFEGIDHNILDDTETIAFKGHLTMTIADVFKEFENKNIRVGKLEFFNNGICNWNAHHWGHWDARENSYMTIDLHHPMWWKQLPSIEILTKTEASNRYETVLSGNNWCVAATATRGSPTLDYENTHAFMEIAIPIGDGKYSIYDFGKFATIFPSTFLEGVSLFCKNLHAAVSYPDENIFYSHREQTYQAFLMTPQEGSMLMEAIKKDVFKALQKNFVYQIESDNCAKWVYFHLVNIFKEKKVPDMFRMHLLDTEPHSFVSTIFKMIKKLPFSLQTRVMTLCHLPLGAAKKTWIFEGGKKVCKSLTRHEFWQTGVVYLPALLHRKKETGLLKAVIYVQKETIFRLRNQTLVVKDYIKRHVKRLMNILKNLLFQQDTCLNNYKMLVLKALLNKLKLTTEKRVT